MGDNSIQLLIAAFQDEAGADAALKLLKEAKKENLISIKDAAVLRKDASGKLHVSEVGDMTGTKGAGVGVVVGAALGILTGGATLAIAGVGAIAGGLAAKLRDSGFKDDRLKKLGEGLKPGSSAIIALTGDKSLAAAAQSEFRKAGAADVLIEEISADVANQLEAGREVAFTAAASEKGVAMGRAVTGDDLVAVSGVAATEDGIVASSVVATADGVAAERLTATEDSVTDEAAAVVVESDGEKKA